uniref:Lipocalin-2 1 n=1 Tax=Amblyomma cajennense TaxID=34607 RepID=A0A023FQE9_AMBCJ
MNSFAIALFVVLGSTAIAAHLKPEDLYNALNTPHSVWMVARSYKRPEQGEQNKCVHSRRLTLTRNDYTFYQYYKHGSTQEQKLLYAGLTTDRATGEPAMDVNETPGQSGQLYTLRFWDKVNQCGILTVDVKGKPECEMYAWDANVRNPSALSECDVKFSELCRSGMRYEVFIRGEC